LSLLTIEQLPKAVRQDFPKWVNRIHVVPKGFGDAEPMHLNGVQKKVLELMNNWSILLKPRQVGGTTLCQALLLYFADKIKNSISAVISYNMENAEFHIRTMREMLAMMPDEFSMPLSKESNNQRLVFKHTGAMILAKSGGTEHAGRGHKLLSCLCTEASRWTRDYSAHTSVSNTIVPGGWNMMESTPNGMGNLYQEIYFTAKRNSFVSPRQFSPIFIPWSMHNEFRMKPTVEMKYDAEERDLIKKFSLTDDQLFWRRSMLPGYPNYSQRAYAEFCSEYPLDEESCWLVTNDSPFDSNMFSKLTTTQPMKGKYGERIYAYKNSDRRYFMGVDTSLGGDNSDDMALVVLDDLGAVVCVYCDAVAYSKFSHIAIEMMQYYQANVHVELTGGYGFGVLERLKANKPRGSRLTEWSTNGTSKELMFNKIDDWMKNRKDINDEQLKDQIMRYNMSAKNNKDDALMAFGMALECLIATKRGRFSISFPKSKEEEYAYRKYERPTFIR
jgi:hypothetical protein